MTRDKQKPATPRADDPRVIRSRRAAVDAARKLFLEKGYAGTTMDEIAALAGLTKRTLYNNFRSKDALFSQIVSDVIGFADEFALRLRNEFGVKMTATNLHSAFDELGCQLAIAIIRPEVIALRRLLVGEVRGFPDLAPNYFDRAPGKVIDALAARFAALDEGGLLSVADPHRAGAQFAYLVVGELLDRAILVGRIPPRDEILDCARDGVETFLARYAATPNGPR